MAEHITFPDWLSEVRAQFPQREEFALASAIYSFFHDFDLGFTPGESYQRFDAFVMETEDAA